MEQSEISFYNEISLMMFGFGDSHKPNPETVRLIENIVLKQMRSIVREAMKLSPGNQLKGEDLVFLMRHNKYKMRRFVQYLMNKDLKNQLLNNSFSVDVNETNKPKKPKHELLEFIERIDETGEFTDLSDFDEIKHERQLRADRISQALDEKKYLDFCKARSTSFTNKNTIHKNLEKLKTWIYPSPTIVQGIQFTEIALEVLSYYAYQTVAEIVDYTLLVRIDARSGNDPLKHLPGSYYTATMFSGKHRFEEPNPDYSKVLSSQPPISVAEVKEVMRRVYSPQAGLLNFGGKVPDTHFLFAL